MNTMNQMTVHGENIKFWDKIAKSYDWITLKLTKNYAAIVRRIVNDINDAERVLEVATGSGFIAIALAKSAGLVEAIDVSSNMIEVAKKKAIQKNITNIHFSVQSAYSLEFGAGQFDAVVCSNALHCMEAPEKALSEIRRVLKANGFLIAPTFCHGVNWRSRLMSRLMSVSGFKAYRRFRTDEFFNLVSSSGFEIIRKDISKEFVPLAYVVARSEPLMNEQGPF